MNTKKKMFGILDLEKKLGVMTVGMFLKAFREADELSQSEFAAKIGLSRANLCDLEKDRKIPSPARAVKIAKIIGVPESVLIQLVLQDELRSFALNYTVELKKVS